MIILIISIITVAFAILTALAAVFKRYQRFSNIVFSIGLLSTASAVFGDSMSMFKPEFLLEWKRVVFISEAVMAVAWLLFSISFARTDYWQAIGRVSKFFISFSPLIVILFLAVPTKDFFYSPEFESEKILFLANAGYIFNLILLSYSILSIINLEATLRSSSGTNRWEIKYMILGVGGILSINIFYYSHALLYRSINMYLAPVRTGIVLFSILLIVFSFLRHKAMDVELTVSRKVFYRSLSLIIVGIYLLGLGLIGEGMRYLNPEIGEYIKIFLGFVGAILVLSFFLSEQLRRKVVVLINKHFYSQKYDYRKQWLQFTQLISLEHSFDNLISSIAEGFKDAMGVRGVAIWLREKGNGEFFCARELDSVMIETRPDTELLEFLRSRKWIIDIHNPNCIEIAARSKEFIRKTRASLIVPLLNRDNLIGFIILEEGLAEVYYNYEDYDLLKTLARQTTVAILNARLLDELTEAKEMEAMGRLSSFIIHDLKNATSMLSLIVQNAEEHIDNPDFQRDAIKAISNTSKKITGIIGKLKNLPKKPVLDLEYSDLGYHVKKAIHQLNLNGNEVLSFKEEAPVKTRVDAEEISKVIINLIINALDATNNQGKVEVVVGKENNMVFVKVSDNGCGMSDEFIRKRLFKPFQTTKKTGFGIGLFQCKAIVEAHEGKLKVISREGRGTDFFLYLPLTES